MKFPLATAITTILVLFSSSCAAAPPGTVDGLEVILKEVQDVYKKLDVLYDDYFEGTKIPLEHFTLEVVATLGGDLGNVIESFEEVHKKINAHLGIPDAQDEEEEIGDIKPEGRKKADIEEEEY